MIQYKDVNIDVAVQMVSATKSDWESGDYMVQFADIGPNIARDEIASRVHFCISHFTILLGGHSAIC